MNASDSRMRMTLRPNRFAEIRIDCEPRIPIYKVLSFLDWPERFVALSALEDIAVDHFERHMNTVWVSHMLLAERYLIVTVHPPPELGVIASHARFIGSSDAFTTPVKFLFTAVLDTAVSMSDSPGMEQVCRRPLAAIAGRSQCHQPVSQSFLWKCIKGDEYIDVQVTSGYRHAFKVNKLNFLGGKTPLESQVFRDFVNGRNMCCFVVGTRGMIPGIVSSVYGQLVDTALPDINRRLSLLNASNYQSALEFSVCSIAGANVIPLFSQEGLPDKETISHLCRLSHNMPGFICFQVRLVHFFTKPYIGGYENSFTIIVEPPFTPGSVSDSKRDVLAVSRCLLAARSACSYIPMRDSLLTRYLRMNSYAQVHVLAAVGANVPSDRNEALHGLRFGNAVCNQHTDVENT